MARCATIIFGTVLRAAGDTKTPLKVGIFVNLINVALNFLFIYPIREVNFLSINITLPGFGLGVIGAAIASAIAFLFGGVMITAALFRHPILSPKGQSFRPDKSILLPCLKIATPNAMQRFATSLGYVVFAAMVNSLGEISTAAHTVANTVESAFYVPGFGMQTAAATLAGGAFGAKDKTRLLEISKMTLFVEIILMALSGGLLFITAPFMVSLFSKDAAVILLGTTVLRMVALSEPFYGFSIILEGMMQGMGRTVLPFVTKVIGMWAVRIVGTFVATSFFEGGLESAWGFMILHNHCIFAVYLVLLISGKWNSLNSYEKNSTKKRAE
jgi:putative MATE family efflux protein